MFTPVAFSQHLFSFGVKGGFPLTDPISEGTFNSTDEVIQVFSASKNYVVGPMIELNLPFGLTIEADALYRPLNVTTETTLIPSTTASRLSVDVNSMEFPILLKVHFLHTPILKPYVEAGPTFRYVLSKVQYLSNTGFALGAGVDFKLPLVRIGPELRYSRWGSDSASALLNVSLPPSNQNQVEFLIGLSF
jgi:Outer membrane protein beta-barrel domain